MIYVKIDRATGDVIRRKKAYAMERIFNKPTVWIEFEKGAQPTYDPETHKLLPLVTQPDLSDLNVDVDPSSKRVEGWQSVALTADELVQRRNDKISGLDRGLTRIIEDLMVAVATGQTLDRSAFPEQVWNKINQRRALRGQADV